MKLAVSGGIRSRADLLPTGVPSANAGRRRQASRWTKVARWSTAAAVVLLLYAGGCSSADTAELADDGAGAPELPAQAEWTDHGQVLAPGRAGTWDHRIDHSTRPVTALRKDGLVFLYYTAASGNRPDGGPANRALGVATSTDGMNFTKYHHNPVVAHQPGGRPENSGEEGVFSGGAALDSDGTVVLYFGGMEAVGASAVDGDGVLATSSDGFDFTLRGDVIDHRDSRVYRNGDEIFPIGAHRAADGSWYCYYIGKGPAGLWDLGIAWGPTRDRLTRHRGVLDLREEIRSGGDPIVLSDGRVAVPLDLGGETIQIRVTTPEALHDLRALGRSYRFKEVYRFTMYRDTELNRWFLYYVTPDKAGIHLKSAPIRVR